MAPSIKDALSAAVGTAAPAAAKPADTAKPEAAAQPAPAATPAVNAAPAPGDHVAAAIKPRVERVVTFKQPPNLTAEAIADARSARTGITIARVSIMGCFGSLPIAVTDFSVSMQPDRSIVVYVPAGGPRNAFKHIAPGDRVITDRDSGETVTVADPAGTLAVKRLTDAIAQLWRVKHAEAEAAGTDVYDTAYTLSL